MIDQVRKYNSRMLLVQVVGSLISITVYHGSATEDKELVYSYTVEAEKDKYPVKKESKILKYKTSEDTLKWSFWY